MATESSLSGDSVNATLSSGQLQKLIDTNEALLKTNESLREMVISIVELLKDQTRHVTYAAPLKTSNIKVQDFQQSNAFSTSPVEDTDPMSPSASSKHTSEGLPGNAREGEGGISPLEQVCPMTLKEIEEENTFFRQQYEGKGLYVIHARVGYMPCVKVSAH